LNQYRANFLDYFFYYMTFLGDFTTVLVLTIILCFIRFRYALLMMTSNILSALITQLLKHTLFSDYVRPVKFFEGIHQLNLVPWYDNYYYNSFPSGHSTSAFTTFFCIALITKNRMIKLLMFFIALTVGLSRVYLSQHFLNDVFAGSLIGVVCSFAVYKLFFLSSNTESNGWMDRSLLKLK
ncbi:MAG TPA: phosphatase PAP2 family protein, partial [Bacteroidia bacterium]